MFFGIRSYYPRLFQEDKKRALYERVPLFKLLLRLRFLVGKDSVHEERGAIVTVEFGVTDFRAKRQILKFAGMDIQTNCLS